MPAEDAAGIISAGVANGEGMIAFPEPPKQLWRTSCESPQRVEGYLQDLARQRRIAFRSGDPTAFFRPQRPSVQD